MNPTKLCFLMEDYSPSQIYSFTDPEEAQGRTCAQGTPAPSVCCQIPQVALSKQSLDAWSPCPRAFLQVKQQFPHGQQAVTTLMARARDGGASPSPCLPLLLKVSCGLACFLTPLNNHFFIIAIVSQRRGHLRSIRFCPCLGAVEINGIFTSD